MLVRDAVIILMFLTRRESNGFSVFSNRKKIPHSTWKSSRTVTYSSPFEDENEAINGENMTPEQQEQISSSSAAAVVLQSDAMKSKLASAFTALSENDQYDAVLTGLCAKILDDEATKETATIALQDPISLLKEMNERRVAASGRSLMSLIDATVQTQDVYAMTNILSLGLQNGGITQYGSLQQDLTLLPNNPNARVTLVDGSRKTRAERLEDLPDVPTDDRGSEVGSAFLASTVVGFCLASNVLNFQDITPVTNLILALIIVVGVLDNFYDVIKFSVRMAAGKQKDGKDEEPFKMPEKSSLWFELGSGKLTGNVVRGLARLLSVDTERECECEAGAFFAAYSLGLPCFAFRPNALEAAVLVVESMKPPDQRAAPLDPLLSDAGIMKMLVWLMAPVAMESSKHAQLIVSDPREADGLLQRLEDRAELLGGQDAVWWVENEQERTDLLKWAYAEADVLLRQNKAVIKELTERLAGGAATVGDCVAVMENW